MQLIIKQDNLTFMADIETAEGCVPSCTELFRNFLILADKVYNTDLVRKAYYTSDPECITTDGYDPLRYAVNRYGMRVREHLAVIDENGKVEEVEFDESAEEDTFPEEK